MVEVRGPLFSLEAHGTLADVLTYQDINSKPIVKACRFPTYRASPAQIINRNIMLWCTSIWNLFEEPTKNLWRNYHDYLKLTGYASFMSYMLKRTHLFIWQFQAPPDIGFCLTGYFYVGEFITGGEYLAPV